MTRVFKFQPQDVAQILCDRLGPQLPRGVWHPEVRFVTTPQGLAEVIITVTGELEPNVNVH